MSGTPPAWAEKALRVAVPLTGLLLVVQYLLGLWTNAYAPSSGFTDNTSFPSLDWHYNIGYTLGVLGLVVLLVAALTRKLPFVGLAVLLLVGISIAGVSGMYYVHSSPNDPVATVTMGIGFLIAFWASLVLGLFAMGVVRMDPRTPSSAAVSP